MGPWGLERWAWRKGWGDNLANVWAGKERGWGVRVEVEVDGSGLIAIGGAGRVGEGYGIESWEIWPFGQLALIDKRVLFIFELFIQEFSDPLFAVVATKSVATKSMATNVAIDTTMVSIHPQGSIVFQILNTILGLHSRGTLQ